MQRAAQKQQGLGAIPQHLASGSSSEALREWGLYEDWDPVGSP